MQQELHINVINKFHIPKNGHPTGAGPSFTDPPLCCTSAHKIDLAEKLIRPTQERHKITCVTEVRRTAGFNMKVLSLLLWYTGRYWKRNGRTWMKKKTKNRKLFRRQREISKVWTQKPLQFSLKNTNRSFIHTSFASVFKNNASFKLRKQKSSPWNDFLWAIF